MSIKKTTKFIFPVGDEELNQDTYYRALSEANNGFYPFGENGLWHGGIHLDKKVLNKLGNDEQLHCMANGEVIAYRINEVYPKITYPDENVPTALRGSLKNVAYFSTGFTLVRHLLQMPKTTDAEAEQPAITLYSLYMHQLDWYGYQEKIKAEQTKVQHPHYWHLESGKVDENKADTVFGSVIRADGSGTEVVGLLLKGSKIRLGEKHATNAGWYKIVSISEGTLVTSTEFKQQLDTITGYVWHSDVSPEPTGKKADTNQDYEVIKEDNNTVGDPEVNVKGIAVYEAADDKQKLTYLPPKATFELDGQENGYAKIRKINDCDVPNLLVKENGSTDAPHKGYVKVTSLTSLTFKPEKLNDIVVLKSPIAISSGDFIGYIGHNQQQTDHFNEPAQSPIATIKRPSDTKLPPLLHVELFTCEDLSAFITKTRTLANNLPESEKNLILVEKGARLIQASKADGNLNSGLGIKFISEKYNYYVKINLEYTLNSKEYYADNNLAAQSKVDEKIEENDNDLSNKTVEITLTADNKEQLENKYNETYPQLTKSDIPDKVELVEVDHNNSSVKIRFCVNTKYYWIASKDVSHLFGQDGTLNNAIPYWNNFPISLDNLPPATKDNTVHFPRTVSLNSLSNENLISIEGKSTGSIWVNVTAGNEERRSITGWVNIKKDAQEHIKRISLWHWQGFETVIEKASVGEFYTKINDNRAATLDIEDYTDSMKELHKILTQSLLYSVQRKKTLPPFTVEYLKDGLRNSWTAEMIGHLIIKYESEWYADEALTKWNEIDSLFEKETQKQKKLIEKWLDDNNITMPYKRNSALNSVDEAQEETKTHWQLEKEQRIKQSLWWQKVAQNQQQAQPTNNQTPALSNLSVDGKAWFIHPITLINLFLYLEKNIITFYIYLDGRIKKYIPSFISEENKNKYRYIIIDNYGIKHKVCDLQYFKIKEKYSKAFNPNTAKNFYTAGRGDTASNVSDGDTYYRIIYANGEIAEWGKHGTYFNPKLDNPYTWRVFGVNNNEVELLKMPDTLDKQFDNFSIKYGFKDSQRRYANPGLFAAMLGSIAVYNKSVTTTGSAFKWGSCFPSVLHINGMSIDFKYRSYISKDTYHPHSSQQYKDDLAFLNAMRLFFEKIRVGQNVHFTEFRKLENVIDGGLLHDHHFHADFSLTKIEEIKE